jgi:hypothetical protein
MTEKTGFPIESGMTNMEMPEGECPFEYDPHTV